MIFKYSAEIIKKEKDKITIVVAKPLFTIAKTAFKTAPER
jgi:hypothetical protein